MISLNGNYKGLLSEIPDASTYSSDFVFKGGFLIIPLKQKKLVMGIGITPVLSNKQSIKINESSEIHTVKFRGNISEAKFSLSYMIKKLSIAAFKAMRSEEDHIQL